MRVLTSGIACVAVLALFEQGSSLANQGEVQKLPVIGLHLVTDRKAPADVWVRAGRQATTGRLRGLTVGLTPTVRGPNIELAVVRLADESGGGDPTEIAGFELALGDVIEVDVESMHLQVTWFEILPGAGGGEALGPAGPCTVCCVMCDGQTTCGCRVTTPCGNCCCPSACSCGASEVAPCGFTPSATASWQSRLQPFPR